MFISHRTKIAVTSTWRAACPRFPSHTPTSHISALATLSLRVKESLHQDKVSESNASLTSRCSLSVEFQPPLLSGIATRSNLLTPFLPKMALGGGRSWCSEQMCVFISVFKPGVKWAVSMNASPWVVLNVYINPETPTCKYGAERASQCDWCLQLLVHVSA